MSAWGCDGASTTAEDFPALRLDDLLQLRDSGPLSETEMIDYLVACGLRGEQRRPGIETLTHAFIPAPHVDHCHPDAVIALTSFPGSRAVAEAEFGDEAIWFDYRQFDVGVARELAGRIAASPRCRFVLLANHGLFTWGQTSEECYRNSLEAVTRSARAVQEALLGPPDLGGPAVAPVPPEDAEDLLVEILPAIRGALSAAGSKTQRPAAPGPGVVLHLNRSPYAVQFASSARGPKWSQAGPSCPDHVVTVGYRPLVLDGPPVAAEPVLAAISQHRRWYDRYFQLVPAASRALGKRDDAPQAIVLPGLGVMTSGPDAAKARLCADHLAQTMTVIRAADAAGGYESLTEEQGAADEYWPLMRLKPQLWPPDGLLASQVFLVAGGDGARVGAVAGRLAAAGAHVALAGSQPGDVATAAREISARYGERRAVAAGCAAGDPHGVVRDAVLAYGGFDAVIDMTGAGELVHQALPVLARQGLPGSVLLAPAGRTARQLREQITALEAERAGVPVNAVSATSPAAVADAAAFFAARPGRGPADDAWHSTVLYPSGS